MLSRFAAGFTARPGVASRWIPALAALLTALILFAVKQIYSEIEDARYDAKALAASLIDAEALSGEAALANAQGFFVGALMRTELAHTARYCQRDRCVSVPTVAAAKPCAVSSIDFDTLCVAVRSETAPDNLLELRYSLHRAHRDAWRGVAFFLGILLVAALIWFLATRQLRARVAKGQADLIRSATRDTVTGLLNRGAFESVAVEVLERSRGAAKNAAMLYLDLDGFKVINDRHGHHVGDQVLQEVARRLAHELGTNGIIGRLGGDEFGVIAVGRHEAAEQWCARLFEALAVPINVGLKTLSVGLSIGAVDIDDRVTSFGEALRCADVALYEAKRCGRGRVEFFSEALDQAARLKYELQQELRTGIEDGELFLEYQPQVNAEGSLSGVEALVRWKHPTRGLVRPDQFISLAEEAGLIGRLGLCVVEMACADLVKCRQAGVALPYISVNVSPLQLAEPDLVASFERTLSRHHLGPRDLELEVTESCLMDPNTGEARALEHLAALGFRIAIDDFGTGYSSLSRLNEMPVDKLKIDRSFVRLLPGAANDSAVAETILGLARRLKLKTVAEGVETLEQARWLIAAGCGLMQGFYFAKPMGLDDLFAWARNRNAAIGCHPTWAETAPAEAA